LQFLLNIGLGLAYVPAPCVTLEQRTFPYLLTTVRLSEATKTFIQLARKCMNIYR